MTENEQTIPVQIRFPREIVRRIDMKIDSGEFTSRADYVRYVTTRSFEDAGSSPGYRIRTRS